MPTVRFPIAILSLALLAHADKLDEVLTKMDAAAASFQGMSAQVSYTKMTYVVNDKSVKSGGIYMKKDKGGYKFLIQFNEPERETVLFEKSKAQIYHEKINQIEEYDLGNKKDLVDQFLVLGFGGGGHELAKSYNIALGADEVVDGKPTVKLELTPKGSVAKTFSKIELWIAKDKWTPVQQRFTEPSKDYTEVNYSNVQEGAPNSVFTIKTNKKPKVVKPAS